MNYANRGQVIIVEDDEDLRCLLEDIVRSLNYRFISFSSASKALHDIKLGTLNVEIKTGLIPVIISDNHMPEMGGLTFLKTIRKDFSPIPFILMTAFGSNEIFIAAKDAGAFAFIRKPFALSEIEDTLSNAFSLIYKSKKNS